MTFDEFRARISADLKSAMRNGANIEMHALRALLSALDNATAVPVPAKLAYGAPAEVARREPSMNEVNAIVQQQVERCSAAFEEFHRLGIESKAAEAQQEIEVLSRYIVTASKPASETAR